MYTKGWMAILLKYRLPFHLDRFPLLYPVGFHVILRHLENHPVAIAILVDYFWIVRLIRRPLVGCTVLPFLGLLFQHFVVHVLLTHDPYSILLLGLIISIVSYPNHYYYCRCYHHHTAYCLILVPSSFVL